MDVSLAMPDIASMSMVMSQNKVMESVGTAIMAKALDTYADNGSAMTKMMELSVNPDIGANFDMSV